LVYYYMSYIMFVCIPYRIVLILPIFTVLIYLWYIDLQDLASFPTRRSSDLRRYRAAATSPAMSQRLGHERQHVRIVRAAARARADRKSTRLNSSHVANSYAGFCLKK